MTGALSFNPWVFDLRSPANAIPAISDIPEGAELGKVARIAGIADSTPQNLSFDDPIERAAIQAEAMPVRRTRKRMMSWAQAEDIPKPGDYCGCCSGSLWWSDTDPPRGWCCTTCHPPCHLQAGQFRAVAT